MRHALCFVLMPFGRKRDAAGREIDFDAVYGQLIRPGIEAAELEPLRADEERFGGVIHKAMFERLVLCEFAVADLTTANANVFYELGVRHGVRPWSTVLMFARGAALPFDVAPLRALPYDLSNGALAQPDRDRDLLAEKLKDARAGQKDSPVFSFVENLPAPAVDIARLKTDVFREQVDYSRKLKCQLAGARKRSADAVRDVEAELGAIDRVEASVVVDLFLSYRDVKAWDAMIALVPKMSQPLAQSVLVREQLALALNRAGRGEEAERVLQELLEQHGPSSETYGILGRVYKDRWDAAQADAPARPGILRQAIDAYRRGFEADWRDAYPGVNALTLMEFADPPDPRRLGLLPVVRYAVERRIAGGKPDYWDYATLLELAVLAADESAARSALADALAHTQFSWMTETTARNLQLIRKARQDRGQTLGWDGAIEDALSKPTE